MIQYPPYQHYSPYVKWFDHQGRIGDRTFVTNFQLEQLPIYQRAIAKHGDHRLYIGPPEPPSKPDAWRALRMRTQINDLSDFWTVFYRIMAEVGGAS